jgi:hypothetical protein
MTQSYKLLLQVSRLAGQATLVVCLFLFAVSQYLNASQMVDITENTASTRSPTTALVPTLPIGKYISRVFALY